MRKITTSCLSIVMILIVGIEVTSSCQRPPANREMPAITQAVLSQPALTDKTTSPTLPISERTSPPPTSTFGAITETAYASATPAPNPIQEMIAEVNQARAMTDLRRLTGVEPICIDAKCYTITGRDTGSEGLRWAKDYVRKELASLNYTVEVQNWTRDGYSDQNLIVRKQGILVPGEEIQFIAHLDGYPANNPAADDDASGAVSLLELARILSGHFFSRTVVLIFSTGEEHGSLGSQSYVNQLTQEQVTAIKYAVSVEMISYDSNNDGAMQFWSGNQPVDFAQLLVTIVNAYPLGLSPRIVTGCS